MPGLIRKLLTTTEDLLRVSADRYEFSAPEDGWFRLIMREGASLNLDEIVAFGVFQENKWVRGWVSKYATSVATALPGAYVSGHVVRGTGGGFADFLPTPARVCWIIDVFLNRSERLVWRGVGAPDAAEADVYFLGCERVFDKSKFAGV